MDMLLWLRAMVAAILGTVVLAAGGAALAAPASGIIQGSHGPARGQASGVAAASYALSHVSPADEPDSRADRATRVTIRVINSSSSSGPFSPFIRSCPRHSLQKEHSQTFGGYNFLGQLLFTTTFHKIWCYNGNVMNVPGRRTRVTAILKVGVVPDETRIGSIAGWTWEGLERGTSDDYYFNATGRNRFSAEHSFRQAKWKLCAPVSIGCTDTTYVKENMNVFWDGTWQFWPGPDQELP